MKRTVLVVEDDPSIGHLLVFILERDGYSVHWESLGQAAERYIHAPAAPQAVVLDMNVSGIDGYSCWHGFETTHRGAVHPCSC